MVTNLNGLIQAKFPYRKQLAVEFFVYPVWILWWTCSQRLKLFGFPIYIPYEYYSRHSSCAVNHCRQSAAEWRVSERGQSWVIVDNPLLNGEYRSVVSRGLSSTILCWMESIGVWSVVGYRRQSAAEWRVSECGQSWVIVDNPLLNGEYRSVVSRGLSATMVLNKIFTF